MTGCPSFIYDTCHHVPQAFYPLPWAGYPHSGSIHELAAPKMHSQRVATLLVGSYPTFSPLPREAVVFFCITQPSRTASTLGSRMPYAARTFLFRQNVASDELHNCFSHCKGTGKRAQCKKNKSFLPHYLFIINKKIVPSRMN